MQMCSANTNISLISDPAFITQASIWHEKWFKENLLQRHKLTLLDRLVECIEIEFICSKIWTRSGKFLKRRLIERNDHKFCDDAEKLYGQGEGIEGETERFFENVFEA